MVYKWQGYSFNVNAQTVGEEIEKIEKSKGEVKARDIVDAAKDKKNPMHNLFEWNDKKAADANRLDTARRVLCCLVTIADEKEPTRAYVNTVIKKGSSEGRFINIVDAMNKIETREIVLKNALAELASFRNKYSKLSELASVFAEIDKLNAS